HRTDPGEMWLDHKYHVCRAAQPRHPPVRSGDRAPGQYPVSGRRGLAGSVGPVPDVPQFCLAPRQFAPAVAGPRCHERSWLSEGVAALYTGDGGRIDRPRLVAERGTALSRATVAAGPGTV